MRRHIVLVPGFGGFDALGQLDYYAGVTSVFKEWCGEREVSIHYFGNFPTAAVATRARRLRDYLGKLVQRRVIQKDDWITLVGHSTGGLDIRQLIVDLHDSPEPPKQDATHETKPLDPNERQRLVDNKAILALIDRVVFLSVPQLGTNIADWCKENEKLVKGAIGAHDAWWLGFATRIAKWFKPGSAQLIDKAVPDISRQIAVPEDPEKHPYEAAAAREAAADLDLWLKHAEADFFAIEDLASSGSGDRPVDDPERRARELEIWKTHGITPRSYATRGRPPFNPRIFLDRPNELAGLLDVRRASEHDDPDSDFIYRVTYAACATGPFADAGAPAIALRWFPGCQALGEADDYEPTYWDNDGIVNTASMLWPNGADTQLVSGDHGDIIGHYSLRPEKDADDGSRIAYDLLHSTSGLDEKQFAEIWKDLFEFAAAPRT